MMRWLARLWARRRRGEAALTLALPPGAPPGLMVRVPQGVAFPRLAVAADPVGQAFDNGIARIVEGAMAQLRRCAAPERNVALWVSAVQWLPGGPALRTAGLQGDDMEAVVADAQRLGAGELYMLRQDGAWLIPRTDA